MKKLLTSLATVALIGGSVSNSTAFIGMKHQPKTNALNKAPVSNPKVSATNEDAQQIADKLNGKTVYVNPNYWMNKDVRTYINEFRSDVIRQGILPASEAQYLTLEQSLVINQKKVYASAGFGVEILGEGYGFVDNMYVNAEHPGDSAQQIANKLKGKSVKLDPNFWVGKSTQDYIVQFNAALVKAGLITQYEAKYTDIKLPLTALSAHWYWSQSFKVYAGDDAIAGSNLTVNDSLAETPAQIAAKLSKETIQFNFNWWKGKDLAANWAQIPEMIANEHLLTKAEASDVIGISYGDFTVESAIARGLIGFDVNDNNTVSNATPTINVVNDGLSAQELAAKTKGTYYLKGSFQGQYMDAAGPTADFRNYLVNDNLSNYTLADANAISLPHVKLTGDNTINATVAKDGQIGQASFTIDTQNYPQILVQNQTSSYFNALVTLTPTVFNYIKHEFSTEPRTHRRLKDFYHILDDTDKEYFKWNERLEDQMGSYGNALETTSNILIYQSKDYWCGQQSFCQSIVQESHEHAK